MKRSYDDKIMSGGSSRKNKQNSLNVPNHNFASHSILSDQQSICMSNGFAQRQSNSTSGTSGTFNMPPTAHFTTGNMSNFVPLLPTIERHLQQPSAASTTVLTSSLPLHNSGITRIGSIKEQLDQHCTPTDYATRVFGHQINESEQTSLSNIVKLSNLQQQQQLQLHSISQDYNMQAALSVHQRNLYHSNPLNIHSTIQNLHHKQDNTRLKREIQTLQQLQGTGDLPSMTQQISGARLPVWTPQLLNQPIHLGLGHSSLQQDVIYDFIVTQSNLQQQQQQQQLIQSLITNTGHVNSPGQGVAPQLDANNGPTQLGRANNTTDGTSSSRPVSQPVLLSKPDTDVDRIRLSDHQYLLRQQIELFEADEDDVATHTRGRNKPIALGQVGIRCKHCAHISVSHRQKGSTYYPSNIDGIYQAAQNMSSTHIQCGLCNCMPLNIKLQFVCIMENRHLKSNNNCSGRPFWSRSVSLMGFVDTEQHGIRSKRNVPDDAIVLVHDVVATKKNKS